MDIVYPCEKKIGVGVSGGADSMVLLSLLRQKGAKLIAINFEHGLRGESSISDSRFVEEYCREKSIPLLSYSLNTRAATEVSGESAELAARRLRYERFEALLSQGIVDIIALAHHADDNAETILMRILRGTGIKGLCGIRNRECYIHPLLGYTKDEILSYAEKNGIPFVTDETNFESEYTRNFLRNEVFSLIKSRYPDYAESFSRLSKNAEEAYSYIEKRIVPYTVERGCYTLPIGILQEEAIIFKASVGKLLSDMGAVQDIEERHLAILAEVTRLKSNARLDLPFGITLEKGYDKLSFFKKTEEEELCSPFSPSSLYSFKGREYSFISAKSIERGTFDLDKVPETAVIRTRREGDSFKKVNGRTKKLGDFLTDIKLPKLERERLLLLANGNIVLAILGIEVSEYIKVDETTEKLVKIIAKEKE